jgi:hypothetical protein
MLRTTPTLDMLRTEMRLRVCPHCRSRPRHNEALGPEVVRPCEMSCALFVRLPVLCKVAILADPMIHPRREAVRHWIAQTCGSDPAVADGPVNRYRHRILDAMSEMVGDD